MSFAAYLVFFADDSLFFEEVEEGSCCALLEQIDAYCKTSYQTVNLEKNNIVFSSNTHLEVQEKVARMF